MFIEEAKVEISRSAVALALLALPRILRLNTELRDDTDNLTMKSDSIPARICVYSTSLSISSVVLVITVVVAQLILNWINKDYAVLTPPPSLPDKASVTVSHSLVHFPTEVSWFSSKPPGDDVDADFQHPVPLQSSLDDHTLAIVKKKLQVQGLFI